MPEHLRALVFILAAAVTAFWLAEKPLTERAIAPEDYKRRRNVWFGLTFIVFFAHNFWLYIVASAILLIIQTRKDANPMALYGLVLFTAPPLEYPLPGFGLVNSLFTLSHLRLMALALLLPAACRFLSSQEPKPAGLKVPDMLMAAYLGLLFILQASVDSVTGTMRTMFCYMMDVWLPYYVASRSLRSLAAFREMAASFVLALAIMGLIGVMETARSWLLYDGLVRALRLPEPELGTYLLRSDGGPLRSYVSAGHAIVLGYVMMVGLGWLVFIQPSIKWSAVLLAGLGITGGILAAFSRGPWVGAVLTLVIALGMGPGAARRIGLMIVIGIVVFGSLLMSPLGPKIIDLLPWVGTVDEFNVQYRERLFEISMIVLWQNPLFGAFDYLLNPVMEEMRQGQGIIDIVNSYIAVALGHGLVGLFLFLCPFAWALLSTWRTRRAVAAVSPEGELLGRTLLGLVLGVLLTIATVSSIGSVPIIYWMLVGVCAAYAAHVGGAVQQAAAQAWPGAAAHDARNARAPHATWPGARPRPPAGARL